LGFKVQAKGKNFLNISQGSVLERLVWVFWVLMTTLLKFILLTVAVKEL